jgi:hypothetical protein
MNNKYSSAEKNGKKYNKKESNKSSSAEKSEKK